MALARIISRSHQCSRELALDLLARGYAVEIVSPDAIPDNLADLELRLEADNANQLTASVEAHGGAHAASLDFVHHLKAPMADFVRRPPETSEAVYFPAHPVAFNAEPGVAEDVELPSENWHAPEPARPTLGILPDPEKNARPITPPKPLLPPAKEPAKRVRRGLTLRIHRSDPKQLLASAKELAKHVRRGLTLRLQRSEPKETRVAHSRGWFWRPGITFAAVVVLALVLGRGIRWGGGTSADPASQIAPGETAAPLEATLQMNEEPKHAAAPLVVQAPAGKSEVKAAQISKTPVMPRVHTNSKKSRAVRSRSREDDLVARDTVIYFDRSASASPVKDSRRRASSRKQRGAVVSADKSHF